MSEKPSEGAAGVGRMLAEEANDIAAMPLDQHELAERYALIIEAEAVAPAVREADEPIRNLLSLVELKFGNTDETANAAMQQARDWLSRYRHLLQEDET